MAKPFRAIILLCLVGFPFNFIWEYLQIPLFHSSVPLSRLELSIFSTVLDLAVILLIYFLIAKIYKDNLWFTSWNFLKATGVVVCGIVIAISGEKIALVTGLWSYTKTMPTIPIIHISVPAILELAIMPLVTFYICSKVMETTDR